MFLELRHKSKVSTISFGDIVSIGKSAACDLQLKGWFVADKHAVIKKLSGGYVVEDLKRGANGTLVNGRKIDLYGPVNCVADVISISGFDIRIIDDADTKAGEVVVTNLEVGGGELCRVDFGTEHSHHIDSDNVRDVTPVTAGKAAIKALELEWMATIKVSLLKKMDLRRKDVANMSAEELRAETNVCLDQVLFDLAGQIPDVLRLEWLKKSVMDETVGLGALEELLSDPSVTEIMVNARDEIFVERSGKLRRSHLEFSNDKSLLDVIERIVAPLGRRIDESSPMVDARLADGSRVNAIIPPLAIRGPTLTIRKFPTKQLTSDDLVQFGSLSEDMADFLDICVKHKKNILISGGTGSGKTTLLNVLSSRIPKGDRVITIEDAAELKLNHDHLISLEARPANCEGKGLVQIRDLVKNSLRMRPDRIVIGECRGAEALDMLQAMNTGHEGSLTTLHSNNPRDAIARLETMVLMAGMDLPLLAIRDQIASAVDIVIQQTRFSCGSRKITYITELTGLESGKIQMQDIFRFNRSGMDVQTGKVAGSFNACETVPAFYEDLRQGGVALDVSIFGRGHGD